MFMLATGGSTSWAAFQGGKSFQSFILSVCCEFSPLNPVSGSKQSLLLGVKIPFLPPCLDFLEDTLAHSTREALFSRHKHGVVARGCDSCVLQTFKARVPERYLRVKLSC